MLRVDASTIVDWDSFHDVFAQAFGFPDFYGRNMNAFIDCLTDLDEPDAGLTSVHVDPGNVFVLVLQGSDAFKAQHPELHSALVESLDFVNKRRVETGDPAVISLREE